MYIASASSLETGKSQEYYPVGRSTSVSFSDWVRCMREGNLRVYHPDDLLPTRGNMYFSIYCWWFRNSAPVDMVNLPVFTRVSYIHSCFAWFFSNEQPAFPSTSSTSSTWGWERIHMQSMRTGELSICSPCGSLEGVKEQSMQPWPWFSYFNG